MKTTTFITLLGFFATAAMAAPTDPYPTTTLVPVNPYPSTGPGNGGGDGGDGGNGGTPYVACTDLLYSSPQCCATDVLGVADLDCGSPSAVPTSVTSFRDICASGGQRARCCVLPVLGQSVLCQTPVGLGPQ
ncbi:hydrophobin [Biscogniauxia marginata]|nr:hydrophobin [Biscogniauxia marginata]